MASIRIAVALSTCAVCAALLAAEGDVAAYLKDGKLTHTLEIRDVQGGVAGFTGTSFRVEPDGAWTTAQVMNQKASNEKKGTLTMDQVATLAKALAKYDTLNLKSAGKPMTNPHVVTIKFGKVEGTLNLPAGAPLP